MSGGDFVSKSEGSICAQRGIEDRVKVAKDLNAVVKRHGEQAAAFQLGLAPGVIDQIAARKTAITGDLLTKLYGSRGHKLLSGLASMSGEDADVAKLMAAATRRAPVTVYAGPSRRDALDAMRADAPTALAPLASVRASTIADREAAALAPYGLTREAVVAWIYDVKAQRRTWPNTAVTLRLGVSTIMDLESGRKPFNVSNLAHLMPLRTRWLAERDEARATGEGDQVKEQNSSAATDNVAEDRGAAEHSVVAQVAQTSPLPATNTPLAEAVRFIAQAGEAPQAGGSHRSPPVADDGEQLSGAVSGHPSARTAAASEGEAVVATLPPSPPSTIVGGDHAVLPPAVVGVDILIVEPPAGSDRVDMVLQLLTDEADDIAAKLCELETQQALIAFEMTPLEDRQGTVRHAIAVLSGAAA